MITEDYCSFEITKLLKEKGFTEKCYKYYTKEGLRHCEKLINNAVIDDGFPSEALSVAPTHQMVHKWLREVHNLHITIKPYITVEGIMYLFELYKLEAEKFTLIKTKTGFEKSELTNEAALKYILENLI